MFHRVYSFSEFSAGQIVTPTKGAETVMLVDSAIRHLSREFGRCAPGTARRICNSNFPVTLRHLGSALLLKRFLNLQGNARNTIYNIQNMCCDTLTLKQCPDCKSKLVFVHGLCFCTFKYTLRGNKNKRQPTKGSHQLVAPSAPTRAGGALS